MAWFLRKKQSPPPSDPRVEGLKEAVRALQTQIDDLESAYEWLSADLKKLRGRVTGGLKKAQDAPGDTNGEQSVVQAAPFSPEWWRQQKEMQGVPQNPFNRRPMLR